MKKQSSKLIPFTRGEELYLGIDAAKSHLVVAVVRRSGARTEVVYRSQLEATEVAVRGLVKRFPGAHLFAAYEAGPTGYGLLRWLRDAGVQAFMTPPSATPVASGDRVKTNRRDAVKLATLLAGGQLKRVRDLTVEQYADRAIVRARRSAVNARSDIMRQLKSFLLMHHVMPKELLEAQGEEVDEDLGDHWNQAFLRALETLKTGNENLDLVLVEEVRRYRDAEASVNRYTQLVRLLAQEPRYAGDLKRLRTIDGLGLISGMEILVERGGDRFDSCAAFASYTGMTCGENSTGDNIRRGHITRTGNDRLRTTLVELAWRVKRSDPTMRALYDRLVRRRGGPGRARATGETKRAIVAVARHLAVVIHAMLRDKTEYRVSASVPA